MVAATITADQRGGRKIKQTTRTAAIIAIIKKGKVIV
jgi:hypothetical protein